jgi:mono/diheme cytochrome c family protein
MKFILQTLALVILLGAGVAWTVSIPKSDDGETLASLIPDNNNGAQVFLASGCSSCHAKPGSDDKVTLAGGYRITSPFGTFISPNISQDPEAGIGGWNLREFATAVRLGVSPEGTHYFPAFPYASYNRMTDQDVTDLFGYMQSLPADATPSADHEVGFPFSIRRAVGIWKARYMTEEWVAGAATPELERGRYLVESLGHCAECHTPRDAIGGLDRASWMTGGPNPSGDGRIPNIHPSALGWSAEEITDYLDSGFTPEFDVAGGSMKAVVENYAQLPASDRAAVAKYLVSLP